MATTTANVDTTIAADKFSAAASNAKPVERKAKKVVAEKSPRKVKKPVARADATEVAIEEVKTPVVKTPSKRAQAADTITAACVAFKEKQGDAPFTELDFHTTVAGKWTAVAYRWVRENATRADNIGKRAAYVFAKA